MGTRILHNFIHSFLFVIIFENSFVTVSNEYTGELYQNKVLI